VIEITQEWRIGRVPTTTSADCQACIREKLSPKNIQQQKRQLNQRRSTGGYTDYDNVDPRMLRPIQQQQQQRRGRAAMRTMDEEEEEEEEEHEADQQVKP
jgi:predicted nucleotidyltransferase